MVARGVNVKSGGTVDVNNEVQVHGAGPVEGHSSIVYRGGAKAAIGVGRKLLRGRQL
jgi:hypothetical protein